jgi:integrase
MGPHVPVNRYRDHPDTALSSSKTDTYVTRPQGWHFGSGRGRQADLAATEEKDQHGRTIRQAIPYIDEAGRYADFHSLRHTTGSLLAASGVHPKVAQSLMRHSDINLTMSKYTHTLTGQEAKAVESLPDLSLLSVQGQRAMATGTSDEPAVGEGGS